jgi:hypothetical protein
VTWTDERIIRITPSIRNELARVLEARLGRAAQGKEQESELNHCKQVEALYREALKMRLLERDTSASRSVRERCHAYPRCSVSKWQKSSPDMPWASGTWWWASKVFMSCASERRRPVPGSGGLTLLMPGGHFGEVLPVVTV